ncbi:hypothetical protein, partial [Roseateles sp. P5_E11]
FSASAHVQGLYRQPHGVDADHRSSSRIQAANSAEALIGQATTIETAPRRISTRTSAGVALGVVGTVSGNAMNSLVLAGAQLPCHGRVAATGA